MILVKTIAALQNELKQFRARNAKIGFVPTMGALHAGHISLIEASIQQGNITVCSIFVNPTQFNNAADFAKYPITIEKDIDMLEKAGCQLLFLPSATEMYPPGDKTVTYDLGFIETVLEGKFRPGHFQGVCLIVDKLLAAVQPNTLFLGRKDYQQCMVISKMMELRHHGATLQVCDTVREDGGLAMSSRNMRLSQKQKVQALAIIHTLENLQRTIRAGDLRPLLESGRLYLESKGFQTDYIAIANAKTLEPLTEWDGNTPVVGLVAAFLQDVRLIDNLELTTSQIM